MIENMLIRASKPLGLGQSPAFTMMGWVKSTKTEGQDYIISNTWRADGYNFGIRDGKVAFTLGHTYPANENWLDHHDQEICSNTLVSDGQWHHIVGVFKPLEKKVECYVDGKLDGTVILRKVYALRQDGAPYIGKSWYGDAQVDDIRVYNFALTPQAIKSLYQSYPAALVDPAFQLDFNLSQTGNIVVNSDIVTTAKVHLYRPGKNLQLRLTFPNEYEIKSYSFPEINGESPISGDIIKSRGLTGTIWTINLADNLNGILNASFVGVFTRQTNHLAQPGFEAALYKRGHQIAQKNVATSIWNPTRFLLWTDERKPGNGYEIEYVFTRHKESIRIPGATNWEYHGGR